MEILYQNRNHQKAIEMAAYMKNHFSFLGLSKPERNLLSKDFQKQAKKLGVINWDYIFKLWALPEREFQYVAMDFLHILADKLREEDIEQIRQLVVSKPWWDTVDSLSALVGALCLRYPALVESHILEWAESSNIWLARVSILHQLKYKDKTNTDLLAKVILMNCETKEFFLNKAIGWALREYLKTNKEWVKVFIETNNLHSLSVREGSKYLA